MNYGFLIMGIVPLLIFVIVDSFAGIKVALVTTVIVAVLEAISSLILFNEIDNVTIFSLLLVFVLAIIAYKKKDPYFIKIQPVIISAVVGLFCLGTMAFGDPIFLSMATKYKHLYPPETQKLIGSYSMQLLLVKSTLTIGICMLIHAGLTYWAAVKLSNWWWIAVRGIGFYILGFIAMIWAQLLIT